jgi:hypothetical protein
MMEGLNEGTNTGRKARQMGGPFLPNPAKDTNSVHANKDKVGWFLIRTGRSPKRDAAYPKPQ